MFLINLLVAIILVLLAYSSGEVEADDPVQETKPQQNSTITSLNYPILE